ncbi:hypothetical protein M5K25_001549 [Dendrobium thyrsiflorum]|uniref:Uncharacterized protein n=1 Tax=Dendrobium thyrsiflorum TaxID=117978 RepID=A0ABD0VQC7_DENTH
MLVAGFSSDIYLTPNFLPPSDFYPSSDFHLSSDLTFARHQTSARRPTFVGFLSDARLTPVTGLLPEDKLSSYFYLTLDSRKVTRLLPVFRLWLDLYPTLNLRTTPDFQPPSLANNDSSDLCRLQRTSNLIRSPTTVLLTYVTDNARISRQNQVGSSTNLIGDHLNSDFSKLIVELNVSEIQTPTTPNSTQSELKWVQIKDPKHVWKVRTIIWITKQFQNVTCLYSNRAARRDESNKPKIIKFRYQ